MFDCIHSKGIYPCDSLYCWDKDLELLDKKYFADLLLRRREEYQKALKRQDEATQTWALESTVNYMNSKAKVSKKHLCWAGTKMSWDSVYKMADKFINEQSDDQN